ncbi:DEAD/DEAH box helicase, putative [Plasmodium sp. gorilla clade G3]|nr:DEAD/DEAH box helicase, putative [Plasmodium sp. gorilla clade G3]
MKEPIKNDIGDRKINAENDVRNNNFKSKDCLLEDNNIKDLNSTCSKNMVSPITVILQEENYISNTYDMMENNKNNDNINDNDNNNNDNNNNNNYYYYNNNYNNNKYNDNNICKSEIYIYNVNNKKSKEDKTENIQNGHTNNNIIIYTNKKDNENNNCLNDVINKYLNDLDNQEKLLTKGEHDKYGNSTNNINITNNTNNINITNNTYNTNSINNNYYYYNVMNAEGDILNNSYNNYFNDNNNSYIYHENNNINMNPYLNHQGYIYNTTIEEQPKDLYEPYIPYSTNNNDENINNFNNEMYNEDSYSIYLSSLKDNMKNENYDNSNNKNNTCVTSCGNIYEYKNIPLQQQSNDKNNYYSHNNSNNNKSNRSDIYTNENKYQMGLYKSSYTKDKNNLYNNSKMKNHKYDEKKDRATNNNNNNNNNNSNSDNNNNNKNDNNDNNFHVERNVTYNKNKKDKKFFYDDKKHKRYSEEFECSIFNDDYYRVQCKLYGDEKINIPKPLINMKQLSNLCDEELYKNICMKGYCNMTTIQKYSIPVILKKINLIACSQTGSGKTFSFLCPIISNLKKENEIFRPHFPGSYACISPLCLILCPTRELVIQIQNEVNSLTKNMSIVCMSFYGGETMKDQVAHINEKQADIIICTAGRLLDLLNSCKVSLSFIKYLIFDEADEMISLGLKKQMDEIIFQKDLSSKDTRQTIFFTATFSDKLKEHIENYMSTPYIYLNIKQKREMKNRIREIVKYVPAKSKFIELLKDIKILKGQAIIFVELRHSINNVFNFLKTKGYNVDYLHGKMSQIRRQSVFESFRKKSVQILIATSIAARGLDFPDLELVINYDLPSEFEQYMHRIGRTGRIGKSGMAINYFNSSNKKIIDELIDHLRKYDQPVPNWLLHFKK